MTDLKLTIQTILDINLYTEEQDGYRGNSYVKGTEVAVEKILKLIEKPDEKPKVYGIWEYSSDNCTFNAEGFKKTFYTTREKAEEVIEKLITDNNLTIYDNESGTYTLEVKELNIQ